MQADLETLSRHFSMSISILSREALPINPCLDTGEVTLGGAYDVYFIHTDHRGAPVFLTDESAQVVWTTEYDPFGNALCDWGRYHQDATGRTECMPNDEVSGERVEMNLRLPGQYYDEESGLHYNWHRYYDPKIGRYLTPDNVIGSINPYIYSNANPLRFRDIDGRRTEVIIWQPVSWGSSSFGHVSVTIDDTAYSFGPRGMAKKPEKDYNDDNTEFRDGVGVILPLDDDKEDELGACLSGWGGDYNFMSNNCMSPVKSCLKGAGIDPGYSLFPTGFGNDLFGAFSGYGTTVHENTSGTDNQSAPPWK